MNTLEALGNAALLVLFLSYLQALATIKNDLSRPVVDLGYVQLVGTSNTTMNTTYFQGVRYAAKLNGQDRWKSASAIELQNQYQKGQVYNATKPGPACLQMDGLLDYTLQQSEDCLFLNVEKPMNPTSELLPVSVTIHGGGYVGGSAGTDSLVYHSRGVFSASLNYRHKLIRQYRGFGGSLYPVTTRSARVLGW